MVAGTRQGKRCRPKRRCVLVAALAVVATAAGTPAVRASTTGGGVFTGTAALPQFPCDSCAGSLVGTASLQITGESVSGNPFTAEWPDPTAGGGVLGAAGNLTASFAYSELCLPPIGVTPTLDGSASGSFEISGGLLQLGAATKHGAVLAGTFSWLLVGTTAAVRLTATGLYDSSMTLIASSANPGIVALNGTGEANVVTTAITATCVSYAFDATATVAGEFLQPL